MDMSDEETKSAGTDFRERSTVETLEYRFTAKVAAIETFEKQCGKQHFCASTELFSSRYTRSRPLHSALWILLQLSASFSSPFVSTNPSSSSSISAASRLLSTTAWCVFGSTIQPSYLNMRIRNKLLETAGATPFRQSF